MVWYMYLLATHVICMPSHVSHMSHALHHHLGVPFFMGCIAYNVVAAGAARPRMLLQALVIAGAVLQVFGKAAKFSCFKPCEEMVYIGLDEESRTKGGCACLDRCDSGNRNVHLLCVVQPYVFHCRATVTRQGGN